MTQGQPKNALELYYSEDNEELESLVSGKDDSGCETTSQGRQRQPRLGRMYRVAGTVLLLLLILACAGLVRKMETMNLRIKFPFKRHKGVEKNTSDPHHDRNGMASLEANGEVYNVTKQAALQIMNYRRGTGMILNLHITHHGGTTICSAIGRSSDAFGPAPEFACMVSAKDHMGSKTNITYSEPPWQRNETSTMIATLRKRFHMISWEFGLTTPNPALSETEWENPNLFSILVVRDPISRLLAGDGWIGSNLPDILTGNASKEDWWKYAKNPWFTNNYALRILGGQGECCDGAKTDPKYLENAKALVGRFSVVLDIECLSEGIEAVASLLNITVANPGDLHRKSNHHAPARERIGHDDIYEYLVEKNGLDIALYQWSKHRALIDCSRIPESQGD